MLFNNMVAFFESQKKASYAKGIAGDSVKNACKTGPKHPADHGMIIGYIPSPLPKNETIEIDRNGTVMNSG